VSLYNPSASKNSEENGAVKEKNGSEGPGINSPDSQTHTTTSKYGQLVEDRRRALEEEL
jgi:hypothetical protein